MNEEFKKLFSNLSEKDQKEVANLIRFKNEVKYHDQEFEKLLNQYIELSRGYDKLQSVLDEIREYIDNLPFKDLIPIEVKVIKKILDKAKEGNR